MGLKRLKRTMPNSVHSEKLISRLSKPAERTKEALKVKLIKSFERFKSEAKKGKDESKRTSILRKLKRVEADLKVLKSLSVEKILRYALSTDKNLMAIAANKRLPPDVRMKARISSHKPLSTQLSLLRNKQQIDSDKSDESEQEDVKEEDFKHSCGSQLDKITVNNQIVLMRKDTRRAVVHTINKWTKSIKKLRASKAVGDKQLLFEAKAEKIVKKIKYIKECEPDEISRFALSNTQPAQTILSDAKMPLRSQAIATVIINKFIQNKVEEFRKNFPGCNKSVQIFLKQKKKKKRKLDLQIESERKVTKLRRPSADSEDSNSKTDNGDVNENDDSNDNGVSNSFVLNENSTYEENGEESACEEVTYSEQESSCEEGNVSQKESSSEESDNEEVRLQSNSSKVKPNTELLATCKINPVSGNEVSRTNVLREKKTKPIPKNFNPVKEVSGTNHKRLKPPTMKPQPKVVDPFFVTTTNEEYVTSQVPVDIFDNDNKSRWHNKPDDHIPVKAKSFSNLKNNDRWNNKDKGAQWNKTRDFGESSFKKPFSNNFEKTTMNERRPLGHLGNRKERRKALQQPMCEVKPEKLHPSWEAKKKISSIASFQGKKITFD